MGKNIILEHEEVVSVVEALRETNISPEIMTKFQKMMDRENKDYYKKHKGIISKIGFRLWIEHQYPATPLNFKFSIKKITNIRDHSKTEYKFLWGNYYVTGKKDTEVFAHQWEAKLAGNEQHLVLLENKIKKLKTTKGKEPYILLRDKITKKINFIHDHPERMI